MTGIVDAHAHVWDTSRLSYPWLASLEVLDRPRLPADLDRADGRVTAAIFIQAGCAPDQVVELGVGDARVEREPPCREQSKALEQHGIREHRR